jgi:hypothetical protein
MERSLLLTALCMRNLAVGVRMGLVSGAVAAQALDELAGEVEETERRATAAAGAIRKEEEKR